MSLLASFASLFLSRERLEVGSGIKDHLGVLSQLRHGRETRGKVFGLLGEKFLCSCAISAALHGGSVP